jgi:hypothetical protein
MLKHKASSLNSQVSLNLIVVIFILYKIQAFLTTTNPWISVLNLSLFEALPSRQDNDESARRYINAVVVM